MITSKRQAKVKKKPSKKRNTKKQPHIQIYTLCLIIGLFLSSIIAFFILPPAQTNSQNAEVATNEAEFKLFAPSLLPTEAPLPSPVLPLETFEPFNPAPAASPAAEQLEEDYCINVPVVLYHHIQPMQMATLLGHGPLTVDSTMFESQIRYLKENGYYAASADELINALHNRAPLPEKSVLITIDDGYDDNYTYAFLIAKKYQFLMNFMIPTQLINKPGYMNWDHLREMHASEFARIYNHTATHAPLGYITQQQIDKELASSSADFKRELDLETGIFTYPYGSYNQAAINKLKEHGFVAAFTTDDGREECLSNIMQLKRVRVGNAPISTYGF